MGWVILILGLLGSVLIFWKFTWIEVHSYSIYGVGDTDKVFNPAGPVLAIFSAASSISSWALLHVIANTSEKVDALVDNANIEQI